MHPFLSTLFPSYFFSRPFTPPFPIYTGVYLSKTRSLLTDVAFLPSLFITRLFSTYAFSVVCIQRGPFPPMVSFFCWAYFSLFKHGNETTRTLGINMMIDDYQIPPWLTLLVLHWLSTPNHLHTMSLPHFTSPANVVSFMIFTVTYQILEPHIICPSWKL